MRAVAQSAPEHDRGKPSIDHAHNRHGDNEAAEHQLVRHRIDVGAESRFGVQFSREESIEPVGPADLLALLLSAVRIRYRNLAYPPRTTSLEAWTGFQAKPMRGSKFL